MRGLRRLSLLLCLTTVACGMGKGQATRETSTPEPSAATQIVTEMPLEMPSETAPAVVTAETAISPTSEPPINIAGATPPDFTVAFLADQSLSEGAKAVLQLVRDEGADMVLHQGDFDYEHDPAAWDQQINDTLGPDFPYFASVGNHDVPQWTGYQQKLQERLDRVSGASCSGDLGVRSACSYQGLFFILSGAGILGSGHEAYIREQLALDHSLWRICSWHANMEAMQVGAKTDATGWGVYEACREGGAVIATGHEHSYARTYLMSSFQDQTIADQSSTLRLEPGKSFAFHSGLGGESIRYQVWSWPWMAAVYTRTQDADYGALFCTFYVNGQPGHAQCYFKDIQGRVPDRFALISAFLATPHPTEVPAAVPSATSFDPPATNPEAEAPAHAPADLQNIGSQVDLALFCSCRSGG